MSSNRTIPLAALRPDPRVEQDLRWYFQFSEGEMGLRSNWEMYAREGMFLTRRRSTYSFDVNTVHVDTRAADRELAIRRALTEITPEQRGTLFAAYADLKEVVKSWPACSENEVAELTLAFRDLAGLAPAAAFELHRKSRTTRPIVDWVLRAARRAKKRDATAQQIQAEVMRIASARLLAAVRAYTGAKHAQRRRHG